VPIVLPAIIPLVARAIHEARINTPAGAIHIDVVATTDDRIATPNDIVSAPDSAGAPGSADSSGSAGATTNHRSIARTAVARTATARPLAGAVTD